MYSPSVLIWEGSIRLLRKQPVSVGYLPVWNRARQGPHTGWGEKALSNFTPSSASLSRLGVMFSGWPKQPQVSQRCWSLK